MTDMGSYIPMPRCLNETFPSECSPLVRPVAIIDLAGSFQPSDSDTHVTAILMLQMTSAPLVRFSNALF
jgi:hypothetical protein